LDIKTTEFYVSGAKYDFVGIGEMPDFQTGELLRGYVMSGGFMEAYLIPLYEKDAYNKLVAALPT